MSKPTKLPRFGTAQTNEVEPSSGIKDSGWTLSSLAVSSYANWLARVTYDWLAYLDSGEIDGDLTVDGNLHVTGNMTLDGSAGNLAATTLHVTGATTLDNTVTLAANKTIVLSGTGRVLTGTRVYTNVVNYGDVISSVSSFVAGTPGVIIAPGTAYIPIQGLALYNTLFKVILYSDATFANTTVSLVSLPVFSKVFSGTITGSSTTAGSNSVMVPTTPIAINPLVDEGVSYWIKVVVAGGGACVPLCYSVYVTNA